MLLARHAERPDDVGALDEVAPLRRAEGPRDPPGTRPAGACFKARGPRTAPYAARQSSPGLAVDLRSSTARAHRMRDRDSTRGDLLGFRCTGGRSAAARGRAGEGHPRRSPPAGGTPPGSRRQPQLDMLHGGRDGAPLPGLAPWSARPRRDPARVPQPGQAGRAGGVLR
jgi:hypothetical protein